MRVALLGPLEVDTGSEPIIIGAAKERAVLALLALRSGSPVTTAELIAALWGNSSPKTARKAVQIYVANLRHLLPPASVITTPSGYSLRSDNVDAIEFERLLRRGRTLASAGAETDARGQLVYALALWRGPPLTDLADHELGAVEITRLDELRRTAEEELVDLRLSAGEHDVLVAELEAAVAAEPLRERRWGQLMLALYRCGRQAEALRAYQRLRGRLREELGLEPGEDLVALEDAILAQKPELRWTPRPSVAGPPPPAPGGGRPFGAAGWGPERPTAKLWSPLVPAVSRFFAGRHELLGRLGTSGSHPMSVLTQSVAGLGGVGKTTLAAAWCWQQAPVVDIVWWLRAEADATLIADLADLADELGLGGAGGEDPAGRAERACRALEREHRSWLVVFDNAVDDDLVHRFTPRRGNGQVIVTTRRQDFGRLGPVVDVEVFDPATAEAFLRSRVADSNPAAADEPAAGDVARRLGGLPLALEQAGAYVAYSPRRTFAAYLDRLDDAGLDPFTAGRPLDYQATASTTWQVSIDAAARHAPLAPNVMAAFAYLAPAPLPIDCLVNPEVAGHPFLAATTGDVTAAIDELYAYSLVAIDHDTLSVHRVVRDAARRYGDPTASSFVVDALRRVHPHDVEHPDRWAACAALLPHVLTVAATATTEDPDQAAKISWLLDRAGSAWCYAGASAQATPLLEQAVNLAAAVHGVAHPATTQSRTDLAANYWEAGRSADSLTLYEAIHSDLERALGADHPDTLTSCNHIGFAYGIVGRVTEALTLCEANLAARQRVLGADHPDTMTSRTNLAEAYRNAGRITDAITLYEDTVLRAVRVLGADHPATLRTRNRLALTYQAAGRITEAITTHQANLDASEHAQGADHPDTLTSRDNLALAYQAAGHVTDAITTHQTNLAARQRVLGPDHPRSLQSRNNLALAYQAAGRITDAISTHETNLADRERVLGTDHPHSLQSRQNLDLALQAAERIADTTRITDTSTLRSDEAGGGANP